jgi:hypothetical protein
MSRKQKNLEIDVLTQDLAQLVDKTNTGSLFRVSFINSKQGRQLIKDYGLPKALKDEIFAVWGKAPTVDDPFPEEEIEE